MHKIPDSQHLVDIPDDGLLTATAGRWLVHKHRLLEVYDKLFSTGMKNQWDSRIYIDLFCGPGRTRIHQTQRIVETSPLIALRVPDRFDKYIFCDKNPKAIAALRQRVARDFSSVEPLYLVGDCNDLVQEIAAQVSKTSKSKRVLSFCFIDPYSVGSLKFETIRSLNRFRMDFLILLALAMDANRFESLYVKETNSALDDFLGHSEWRNKWAAAKFEKVNFRRFLAEEFAGQMTSLGYLPVGLEKMKEVRSDQKNLPLYHLAFFSKHKRGYQFWDQVLKYGTSQQSLFN